MVPLLPDGFPMRELTVGSVAGAAVILGAVLSSEVYDDDWYYVYRLDRHGNIRRWGFRSGELTWVELVA